MRSNTPNKYFLFGASILGAYAYNLHRNNALGQNQFAFIGLCFVGAYLLSRLQTSPKHPFTNTLNQYCLDNNYTDLKLSQAEIKQLYWLQQNEIDSPERRQDIKPEDINMEIKRALARVNALHLILNKNTDSAYHTFIKGQDNPITLSQFRDLSQRIQMLSKDAIIAVRASCFLTKSQRGDQLLDNNGIKAKQDSEDFLTQLTSIPKPKADIFPVVAALSTDQFIYLQKAFWPESHLRHMLFTEGGNSMFSSLASGIKSDVLDQEGLAAWQFRWITNLAGFKAHEGINHLDQSVLSQTLIIFNQIEQYAHGEETPDFLTGYLHQHAHFIMLQAKSNRALDDLDTRMIGHLGSFTNINTPEMCQQLVDGYLSFLDSSDNNKELAKAYAEFVKDPNTVTPTYTPAIFTTAVKLLCEDETLTEKLGTHDPIITATVFTCTILKGLYQQDYTNKISCRNIAWFKNMKPMLADWLDRPNDQIALDLKDNELQLTFVKTMPQIGV